MIRKLRDYSQQADADWWDQNEDYADQLQRDLDTYLVGTANHTVSARKALAPARPTWVHIDDTFFCDLTRVPAAPIVMEIGAFSNATYTQVKTLFPDATYIAVEAVHANYKALRRALPKGTPVLHGALAEADEPVELRIYNSRNAHSMFERTKTQLGTETVQGYTLHNLLKRCKLDHVDLLLMNCEGAERFALQQLVAEPTLISRIGQICTDLHTPRIHDTEQTDALIAQLDRYFDMHTCRIDTRLLYHLFIRKG
jgi:FkbM family methyltransferase